MTISGIRLEVRQERISNASEEVVGEGRCSMLEVVHPRMLMKVVVHMFLGRRRVLDPWYRLRYEGRNRRRYHRDHEDCHLVVDGRERGICLVGQDIEQRRS
jgi:hypothetical protein